MEKYIVKLSTEERCELLNLIRIGKKSANKLMHASVLLSTDANDTHIKQKTDEDIAKEMHVSSKTVARIRQRFVTEGLEAALSRRPHANPKSRKLDGEQEAHLLTLCCSTPPEGRNRWTLKLLANKLVALEIVDSVSPATLCRILKKNEMKPWQKREWCIPPKANAEFVCKMENILDVYKRPYDSKRPVVCMDETNKQLTKEVRLPIPASPGESLRYDAEYERNGTCNIFLSCEPLKGKRTTKVTAHRKKTDWAQFIKELVDNNCFK